MAPVPSSGSRGRSTLARLALSLLMACVFLFLMMLYLRAPAWILGNVGFVVFMIGPALLPSLAVAIGASFSERFDHWLWAVAIAIVVTALECLLFWWFWDVLDDGLGYTIMLLFPILAGLPIALISYAVTRIRLRR